MARILGLDVGDKRIGVALSDAMHMISSPHSVYTRIGYGPDARHFAELAKKAGADLLVLGLPLNMDGSKGFQAEKVEAFAEKLKEAGLTVEFIDERLTTVSAERALLEGGLSRQERRGTVDAVAAALILQSFLDSKR